MIEFTLRPDRAAMSQNNMFGDGQMNSELTVQQANEVTIEMREQLLARNGGPVSLSEIKPRSARILVVPESKAVSQFGFLTNRSSDARAWVQIQLPGYSNSRDRAVLRFNFGPTPHGAAATYFLVKQNGMWKVRWRAFAFYV